jgi:hypothetical protein
MKKNIKKISILALFIFFLVIGYSQSNCDNKVSTDWLMPENNALPKDLININGDERFLNRTNWFPKTPGGAFEDYNLSNMFWSTNQLLEMDNIWSSTLSYYDYISNSAEPLPMNGWELLLINLGRYPNDIDDNTSNETFQAIPYIVLYNRYSGTIRIFLNFGLDNLVGNGPDAVEVILSIPDNSNKNGLLRLYDNYDVSLDENTKITKITSIAKATNAQRQWMSCDFQIAYDPCICYFPSKLKFEFNQISEESVYLYGRSQSTTDDLINPQLEVNPLDFLSGFESLNGIDSEASAGILVYKGFQTVIDDYIARYLKYIEELAVVQSQNKIIQNNLDVLEMLKYTIAAIATFGSGSSALSSQAVSGQAWFAGASKQYGNLMTTANKIDVPKILSIAKQILGSDAKTYIEQNFELIPEPNEPSSEKLPKVSYSEMKFKGTITQTQKKAGPNFYTPGTYGTEGTKNLNGLDPILNSMYEYPIYNNALGLFAMLEKPSFEITKRVIPSSIIKTGNLVKVSTDNSVPLIYHNNHSWSKEYQIKIKKDLKYVINKVIDVNKTDIKVALKFKGFRKYLNTNGKEVNIFIDPNYTSNLSSTNKDLSIYDKVRSYSNTDFTGTVADFYGPVTGNWCVNKIPLVNGGYSIQPYNCFRDDTVKFQSAFIPIDAFYNAVFGVGIVQEYITSSNSDPQQPFSLSEYNDGVDMNFFDFEIVLLIDSEYGTLNDKNVKNTSFQSYTYKSNNELIPTSIFNQTMFDNNLNSQNEILIDNENIEFLTTNFNGQAVKNCKLNGNHYTCWAYKTITIKGDLTTDGYTVDIIAGEEINQIPESVISPEIQLKIEKSQLDYSHPMPNESNEYLENFCRGNIPNRYQANSLKNSNTLTYKDNLEVEDILLFPNPSENRTTIESEDEIIGLKIYDVSGKEFELNPTGTKFKINLDFSNLEHGLYLINIQTINQEVTKQFVKL